MKDECILSGAMILILRAIEKSRKTFAASVKAAHSMRPENSILGEDRMKCSAAAVATAVPCDTLASCLCLSGKITMHFASLSRRCYDEQ